MVQGHLKVKTRKFTKVVHLVVVHHITEVQTDLEVKGEMAGLERAFLVME